MRFKLLAVTTLPLQTQLQWVWYARGTKRFIVGDDRKAFAVTETGAAVGLAAAREFDERVPAVRPCNLPVPWEVHAELAGESWHGLRFLEAAAYDLGVDGGAPAEGDLLRTLVFGPDYGLLVLHPASGLVLGLRAGRMELLERTAAGFHLLGKTRTRGNAALAFAGHPTESMIVYGDNAGSFHAHRFDATGWGKASKIAARGRKASRAEFGRGGELLVIGGMGYLATYGYAGGKFVLRHEVEMPVRDFLWIDDGGLVLVNQGLHGVAAYRYGEAGFQQIGKFEAAGAVRQMALSACGRYLGVMVEEMAGVGVYEVAGEG